jgi:hypothetical protein
MSINVPKLELKANVVSVHTSSTGCQEAGFARGWPVPCRISSSFRWPVVVHKEALSGFDKLWVCIGYSAVSCHGNACYW